MIFEWLMQTEISKLASDARRRAAEAEAQMRHEQMKVFISMGDKSMRSLLNDASWRGTAIPYGLANASPTCNCRNCGAPFGFEEKQCSYCKSDR